MYIHHICVYIYMQSMHCLSLLVVLIPGSPAADDTAERRGGSDIDILGILDIKPEHWGNIIL